MVQNGEVLEFPVQHLPSEVIVSTNKAGDSFVGGLLFIIFSLIRVILGFLAGLVQGKSLEENIELGSYTALEIIKSKDYTFPKRPWNWKFLYTGIFWFFPK